MAGTIERINKLITVRPAKTRYNGEVGDIVVGRVIDVQQKLWKVDCGTRLHVKDFKSFFFKYIKIEQKSKNPNLSKFKFGSG